MRGVIIGGKKRGGTGAFAFFFGPCRSRRPRLGVAHAGVTSTFSQTTTPTTAAAAAPGKRALISVSDKTGLVELGQVREREIDVG